MTTLTNPRTGQRREAPEGFSFTTLFFGALVPLCRGDFKWFFIMCVANIFLSFVFLSPLSWLIFAAMYNSEYIKDLKNEGYLVHELPRPVVQPASTTQEPFNADTHEINPLGHVVPKS